MASNRRILKHYVRYSGDGVIIPGGNVLSRVKPKVGNWTETDRISLLNRSYIAEELQNQIYSENIVSNI